MRLLLNCYYPHPEHLALATEWGFHGVRTGPDGPADAEECVARVYEAGLDGLFCVRDLPTWLAIADAARHLPRMALELGNEEDSKQTARDYQRSVAEAVPLIRKLNPDLPLFTAGIVTPNKKRLGWLREVYARGVAPDVNCAIHTYRTEKAPTEAHPGFKGRFEEFQAVREIIGPSRRLIVSEVGWHTCPIETGGLKWLGLGKTVRWSEAQIANHLAEEARLCKLGGADSMTVYQVISGPDKDYYEDNFGLKRWDGSLTPAAARIKALREEVE